MGNAMVTREQYRALLKERYELEGALRDVVRGHEPDHCDFRGTCVGCRGIALLSRLDSDTSGWREP